MKKLFSVIAFIAAIIGLAFLVYNVVCDYVDFEDEDLYSDDLDESFDDVTSMPEPVATPAAEEPEKQEEE